MMYTLYVLVRTGVFKPKPKLGLYRGVDGRVPKVKQKLLGFHASGMNLKVSIYNYINWDLLHVLYGRAISSLFGIKIMMLNWDSQNTNLWSIRNYNINIA